MDISTCGTFATGLLVLRFTQMKSHSSPNDIPSKKNLK